MLIWVEEVVFLQMCDKMAANNLFKYFDEVGGEGNGSIVGRQSSTIPFVLRDNHRLFKSRRYVSSVQTFFP